jgi:hypothetical protein
MVSPNVYPIFWGSWWVDNRTLANQITASFATIAQSGYLSGTEQYLTDGVANVMPAYIDYANDGNLPSQVCPGYNNPASTEIENVLYNEASGIPTPDDDQNPNTPIYVVITPPSVSCTTANGFNEPGFHEVTDLDVREEIWVATQASGGVVNPDITTRTFSHELVEAMTDPFGPAPFLAGEQVTPDTSFPSNTSAGKPESQVADNEPNNNYVYRLGGPGGALAQAYWSDAYPAGPTNQYVVPDGNSLIMQINPDPWVPNSNGNLAFKGGTLVIDANQPGLPPGYAGHQVITLDNVTMPGGPGVQVVMDGESFAFEPGQITSIQLNAANDSEIIAVDGLPPGVPVTLSLETGHYVVKLDPSQGLDQVTDPIQSSVTVNTSPGGKLNVELAPAGDLSLIQASVQVNGNGADSSLTYTGSSVASLTDTQTGPDSGNLQLANGTVSYSGVGTLTLTPSFQGFSQTPPTIGKLVLQGGSFANEQDTVSGAGAGSISLDGGTILYSGVLELDDLITVQSASYDFTGGGFLQVAPVSVVDGPVASGSPTTALQQKFTSYFGGCQGKGKWGICQIPFVMDPVNFANKTDVFVAGGAQNATINVNNPKPAAGLATLVIDPGQGSTNVNVESTPATVATTVTGHGTVTLNAPGQGVQAIRGTVDVENDGGAATNLIVDDTGDANPRAILLDDTSLSGLAPATITRGAVDLTVTGGSGGNSYSVHSLGNARPTMLNAGDGDDTIGVDIIAFNNFALTVNGGPGHDELDVAALTPTIKLSSSSFDQLSGEVSANTSPMESTIYYSDIEKLDVSQFSSKPGQYGNDNNGDPLPPSLGGPLEAPYDLGGPGLPVHHLKSAHKPHKGKTRGGHPRGPRHRVRHAT